MPWSMSQPEPAPEPSPAPTAAASKKKWIIAGVVLALLLIVVLIVVLCLIFLLPEDEDNEIGEQLKKNMNLSAEPCNDFFNYACGGWNEAHKFSEKGASAMDIMFETVFNRTMGLLEAPVKDGETLYKTKVKKILAACTNKARRKERGIAPFMTFFKKIGPFPIIESSFDVGNIVIQNVLTKLTLLMANPLFNVEIRQRDDKNIASSAETLSNPDTTVAERALRRLGVEPYSEVIYSQIKTMLQIQALLIECIKSSSDVGSDMTILELQSKYNWPDFTWLKFLQDVTGNTNYNGETTVHVTHPIFLTNVTLGYFQEGYSRPFVDFLMKKLLNFVEVLDPSTSSPEKETGSEMDKYSNCIPPEKMRLAISCMYVDEFYTNDYGQKIVDIMGQLKEAYRQKLNKTNLSPNEWRHLTSNVDKIQEKVGLIESFKDNKHITYLNSFFEKVTSEEFFEMSIEMAEQEIPSELKLLQGDLAISTEEMLLMHASSLIPYVFYIPGTRYIAVPAASLEPPLINLKWPSSMNFGAIGSLLSREIMSALLAFSQSSWLNSNRVADHIKKCVFSDSSRQRSSDNSLKVKLFHAIQGVQTSFMAYQNFRKSHGEESTIKGLDLNHNQLFFLGYTQMMCQYIYSPESKRWVEGDLSTLISLYSSKDFSEAYSCKADAPMNRLTKCDFFLKS